MLDQIKIALFDYESARDSRTMDAQFRGDRTSLKVIKLRPKDVFLNHRNSRIMVELEGHPDYDEVMADPTSDKSQAIIEGLLRSTPAYEIIREEIREYKQREPGTISENGRIINGNTRVVALRELGWDGFDAGVLPKTANEEDFKEIELGLQLVDFTKQKYSFVNRLRQFEIMLSEKPTEEICRLMGWRRNKVKQYDEFKLMLDIVNEYANRGIPKLFFNSKEEYVKDLAAKVQSLTSSGDSSTASKIKGLRLAAMLCGNSKDEVRNIDVDFLEKYVALRATTSQPVENLIQLREGSVTRDEFSDLFPPKIDDAKPVVDEIIALYRDEPDGDLFSVLADVFRLAGDDAVQANKKSARNAAPIQLLNKLHSDVNQLRSKLIELSDKNELASVDSQQFESGIDRVNQAMIVLGEEFRIHLTRRN